MRARWGSKASCRSGKDSPYRSGRSPHWLKMAPAVKREADSDAANALADTLCKAGLSVRCTFLKIAVRIQELKTRIKMALPSSYPHVQALTALATSIAALAP